MRTKLIFTLCLLIIFFILIHPAAAANAASDGLLLWYRQILPTLLPITILSNFFVYGNFISMITGIFYPFFRILFPSSKNGSYVIFAGTLFGFPMGSKLCSDLASRNMIASKEAQILATCFNQFSPSFFSNYVMISLLQKEEYVLPAYIIVTLPPFVYARYQLSRHNFAFSADKHCNKKTTSTFHLDFGIVDIAITNAFESITKIGGYLILFSLFDCILSTYLPKNSVLTTLCTGCLESTTGIARLQTSHLSEAQIFGLTLSLFSFGGLCGFAQTCSMSKGYPFKKLQYLFTKLIFAIISGVLGYLFLLLRHF